MPILLLEPDTPGAAWAPVAGARPIAEMRAGAWRVRERWERALSGHVAAIVAAHAEAFHELDAPPVSRHATIAGPAIAAAAWFAPAAGRVAVPPGTRRLTHQGVTVARIVAAGERVDSPDALDDGVGAAAEIAGLRLTGAYDLVTALEALLPADCAEGRDAGGGERLDRSVIVLGDRRSVVARGAVIEPGVVLDVRGGAIIVERDAEIRSGTRIEGPSWIGPGSRIVGGFIRASVIGPRCVVRGEVAASVFTGYANKAHDGFVGHSVVGHWVNLGAGTTTSNLKNTYGPVRLDVTGQRIETGRTFLGSLIGDHVKTAIGTLLSTGAVIGAGANVFGTGPVPKYVAPFAWGLDQEQQLGEEAFLRIAARVLPRRDVELTAERAASLRATWRRLTA